MKWLKENWGAILGVLVIIWIGASWINVNAHNNPFSADFGNFAWWNILNLYDYVIKLVQ